MHTYYTSQLYQSGFFKLSVATNYLHWFIIVQTVMLQRQVVRWGCDLDVRLLCCLYFTMSKNLFLST